MKYFLIISSILIYSSLLSQEIDHFEYTFKFIDSDSKEKLICNVELFEGLEKKEIKPRFHRHDSTYSFPIEFEKEYLLTAFKNDYLKHFEYIYIPKPDNVSKLSISSAEIFLDIELVKLKKGTNKILKGLSFYTNTDSLNSLSLNELNYYYQLLSSDTKAEILISAHVHNQASDQENENLSRKRTLKVKDAIDPFSKYSQRILISSKGAREPLPYFDPIGNENRNSRVEVKIINLTNPNQLLTILFKGQNSTMITDSYINELDRIIDDMKYNIGLKIMISGHSDILGTPPQQNEISQKRANRVADYFIKQGIDKTRILINSYGGRMPVPGYDPSSMEGRKLNRRVEIKIIND